MNKRSIYFCFWVMGFFLFLSFFSNTSYANTCEYTEKKERCLEANENEWAPRAIEDFVCLTSKSEQEIVFQIVLDEEFRKIDDEVEAYLSALEADKDRYFWKDKEMSYIQGIDDITDYFSEYGKYGQKYYEACWVGIIEKVLSCQDWEIDIKKAASAFENSTCTSLAGVKLDIYKQVAFDILMLNKVHVRKDVMKKYVIQERKKYDILLDIMMVNIWYIERILKKWPSKILKPY